MKIALIGPPSSGKTRFVYTLFNNENYAPPTCGVDLCIYRHMNKPITLFDTGSGDAFIISACETCDIILLIYDASRDPFRLASFISIIPSEKLCSTYLVANIINSCDYPPEDAADYFGIKYEYVDVSDKDDLRELLNKLIPCRVCC